MTPEDIFKEMPGSLNADAAKGMNSTIQFNLSGDNGGQWYVVIKDGMDHGPFSAVEALQQIARDIRHSYTIGYEPNRTDRRGGFRHITVEARAPDGRRLSVRTRTGYLAQAASRRSE